MSGQCVVIRLRLALLRAVASPGTAHRPAVKIPRGLAHVIVMPRGCADAVSMKAKTSARLFIGWGSPDHTRLRHMRTGAFGAP